MVLTHHKYQAVRPYVTSGQFPAMCCIQNVHTCQCLGEVEPAFTPQDVRSCLCPTIIRMHGLRNKCEQCRRHQRKQTRKQNVRHSGSGNESRRTLSTETSRNLSAGDARGRTSFHQIPDNVHARSLGREELAGQKPQYSTFIVHQQEDMAQLGKIDILTSSSWNAQPPFGIRGLARITICGEANVVGVLQDHGEQRGGSTNQQIINQIEVMLGKLAGMKLAGLVIQTVVR